MSGNETKLNTVYLIGLTPEEERFVWDDFRTYPFPGWQLSVLATGVTPPVDLLEGRAILVIGCGGLRAPDHTETIWRLRLFVCANPWIAVASDARQTSPEVCTAAGAAAYLTRPFSAAKLRELIWHQAIPQMGRMPVTALTCERLVRYCSLLGSDVLLKFSTDQGRTGFLGLKRGQPFHAQLLDGPDGADALHEILHWGKGKVLSLPLPADLEQNLPERSEAWNKLLRSTVDVQTLPARTVPGGAEICDQLSRDLSDLNYCVLVDTRTERVVAQPTGPTLAWDVEKELTSACSALLQAPRFNAPTAEIERVEEAVVTTHDGWCAAFRFENDSLALLLSASGRPQLVLARQLVSEAASKLDVRTDLIVENIAPVVAEA